MKKIEEPKPFARARVKCSDCVLYKSPKEIVEEYEHIRTKVFGWCRLRDISIMKMPDVERKCEEFIDRELLARAR